jgi:hypothetical protein
VNSWAFICGSHCLKRPQGGFGGGGGARPTAEILSASESCLAERRAITSPVLRN